MCGCIIDGSLLQYIIKNGIRLYSIPNYTYRSFDILFVTKDGAKFNSIVDVVKYVEEVNKEGK